MPEEMQRNPLVLVRSLEDALRSVAGQLHSPNGDSDNSNGSQRGVAITRNDVEQQQQPHRHRHQRQATVPVLACTNQSSTTPTTTAFTVASSMLLLQTQVM